MPLIKNPPHTPVLLTKFLEYFKDLDIKVFVDGTLGAGGHAKALLEIHHEIKYYIGFDQDISALETARAHLRPFEDKLIFINTNFKHIKRELHDLNINEVDGFFFDLGVSSMQVDQAERGFSFCKGGPLDMRMNPKQPFSAADLLNTWSEREIGEVIREYGEERHWRAIARDIVLHRKNQHFETTQDLANIIKNIINKRSTIHPATRTFQGIRIAVNDELKIIDPTLKTAINFLRPEGRLGVISFHSLEDRLVKNTFKDASKKHLHIAGADDSMIQKTSDITILTKKPIIADKEELKINSRSRSAKMRFAEKK